MARFQTTRRYIRRGRYHAKIFKGFFVEDPVNGRHPPPDVSGSYRVWFYFPRRYRVPRGTWVNVLQFKEKYRFGEGERSDPFWWIEVRDARWMRQRPRRRWHGRPPRRASAPVAFVNHPRASNNVRTVHGKPIPLGRWVEFRADVHQNDRIDFSIDGELFDTGRASDSPVGPVRGSGSLEWILGIGNYSTGVNGPLYADEASYNLP